MSASRGYRGCSGASASVLLEARWHERSRTLLPAALLGLLAVSYVTRSANRAGWAKAMLA